MRSREEFHQANLSWFTREHPNVKIEGYSAIEEIGRGGMGVVFRAKRQVDSRTVAVKVMTNAAADSLVRFTNEQAVHAMLDDHPNIVSYFSSGLCEYDYKEVPYLVMKEVRGQNLRRLIETGRVGQPLVHKVMLSVCEALSYAHELAVIHRDVKPANILVGDDGVVSLTDFGIAARTDDERFTKHLRSPATLRYAAPEVLMGRTVDEMADVFSLGILLAELITGVTPDADLKILDRLPHEATEWAMLIRRATAISPSERYDTVQDYMNAYRELRPFRLDGEHACVSPTVIATLSHCCRVEHGKGMSDSILSGITTIKSPPNGGFAVSNSDGTLTTYTIGGDLASKIRVGWLPIHRYRPVDSFVDGDLFLTIDGQLRRSLDGAIVAKLGKMRSEKRLCRFMTDGDWIVGIRETEQLTRLYIWAVKDMYSGEYFVDANCVKSLRIPAEIHDATAVLRGGVFAAIELLSEGVWFVDINRSKLIRSDQRVEKNLDLTSDGRFALVQNEDGIAMLSSRTGRLIRDVPVDKSQLDRSSRGLALCYDNSLVALVAKEAVLCIRVADGEIIKRIPVGHGLEYKTRICWSSASNHLATLSPGIGIDIWSSDVFSTESPPISRNSQDVRLPKSRYRRTLTEIVSGFLESLFAIAAFTAMITVLVAFFDDDQRLWPQAGKALAAMGILWIVNIVVFFIAESAKERSAASEVSKKFPQND